MAENALKEYVKNFANLYGLKNLTCNIHSLLHLADNVRKFGPLFITTCFGFENLNGILKKLVKSSNKPELQICSSVSLYLNYDLIKEKAFTGANEISEFCFFFKFKLNLFVVSSK